MTHSLNEPDLSTKAYKDDHADREQAVRALSSALRLLGAGAAMTHPFKELDFFTEADQDDYAGREQDVRALAARVLSSRTTVLYGRSGLGKTSLLRGGLFPILEKQGFRCLYVRVLDSPLKDLAATLAHQFAPKLPTVGAEGFAPTDENAGALLREAAERLAGEKAGTRRTLLVVFDQFEEFFTIFRDQPLKRYAFVGEIASLIRSGTHEVRVMFSLREDYLYALDDFQRQLPDLFSSAYRLLPLSAVGARAAIVKPLENRDISYDDALVTAVLDALAPHEFESARLQLAAIEVFDRARDVGSGAGVGTNVASFELPDDELEQVRSHGSDRLFRRYLDRALDQVPEDMKMDARTLLDLLITEGETKLALPEEELLNQAVRGRDTTNVMLDELEKSRLIRRTEHPGRVYYELRHECLIAKIRDWQKEHRPFADFLDARSAIRNSSHDMEYRERPARLLSEDILRDGVAPNVERLKLSTPEMEFVLWSTIRRGLPEAVEWKARWEAATQRPIAEVLHEMLENQSTAVRAGAAAAVAKLAPDEKSLIARCVELMRERESTYGSEAVQLAAIDSVGSIAQRHGDLELFSQCLKIAEDADQSPLIRVHALKCALSHLVAEKDPNAVKSWLRLALEGGMTPDLAELQRQASLGFANHATVGQVRQFRKRLHWGRTTLPELTLLADFHQACRVSRKQNTAPAGSGPLAATSGQQYSGLGWWLRRKARKAWEQRALSEFSDRVTRARQVGFLNGAVAGLCWYATIMLPTTILLALIWAPTWQSTFLLLGLGSGLLGFGIAWITGWRAVVCLAEARVINFDASWAAAARRSTWLVWVGLVPLLPFVLVLGLFFFVLFPVLPLLWFPLGLLFRRLWTSMIGALERVMKEVAGQVNDKRVQFLWLTLLTLAVWIAAPLLASTILPWVTPPKWTTGISGIIASFLVFGSALTFGWAGALILSADSAAATSSETIVPQARRRRMRLAVIIIIMLLLPWFVLRHGGDGLPIPGFWKTVTVRDESVAYEGRLRLWPDVAAFRLKVGAAVPLLKVRISPLDKHVQIDFGAKTPLNIPNERTQTKDNRAELLLWMPSREGRFILYDDEDETRRMSATTAFKFEPARVAHSSEAPRLRLVNEEVLPVWIDFSSDPSSDRWTSEIEVAEPETVGDSVDVRKVSVCAVDIHKGVLWTRRQLKNPVIFVFDRSTEAEGLDPLVIVDHSELKVEPANISLESLSSGHEAEFRDGRACLRFELSGLPQQPGEKPQVLVTLRRVFEERQNIQQTMERRKEIEADMEFAQIHGKPATAEKRAELAWSYYLTGEYTKARSAIEEAIRVRGGKHAQDQEILGLVAYKLGDWVTAVQALEFALNDKETRYSSLSVSDAKAALYLKAARKKLSDLNPSAVVPSPHK